MVYAGALAAGAFAARASCCSATSIDCGWLGLPRRRARGNDRLHGRLDHRLGDRLLRGRPFLERHGRWLHLDAREARARRALVRPLGRLGRADRPRSRRSCGRSSRSRPAIVRMPLGRYTRVDVIGSAIWCFALAGVGWALGSSWESFHQRFRFVDYAIARSSWRGSSPLCGGVSSAAGRRRTSV